MKISNEAKVGVLVTAVLVLLVGITVKAGNFEFRKEGYEVKVLFDQVDGIQKNAPVMVNGFEMGHVTDIELMESSQKSYMELEVWLDEEVRLREGATAHVKNMGFLGEKYVALTTGTPGRPHLQEGAVIEGNPPVDMSRLMQNGQDIALQIKRITAKIEERLDRNQQNIDEILDHTNISIKNFSSITRNIDERLEANADNIDQIMSSLRVASGNLEVFSHDVKSNPWKLMYRTKEKKIEHQEALK